MHSGSELLGNSDYNVTEDGGTLGVGSDLYGNDLLICNAELSSCLGSKVNMTLSSDNALGELVLCTGLGVNELACAAALGIAGLTDGSGYADGTSVGKRDLNLSCGTGRTENGSLKSALRTDYYELLLACVLTGLAEILLLGELLALTEEYLECLAGYVNVSCGSFN